MLPTLQIGPLALQTPGLILLLTFWIALDLAERQASFFDQNGSRLSSMLLFMLAAGVVGARLVFAAGQLQIFLDSPLALFSFSPLLLNFPGGLILGLVGGLAYGQRHKLPLWPTLDALAMAGAILLVGIGLANFASGDAYGQATTLPWALELWGAKRHPTQVYETLAALGVAIALWPRSSSLLTKIVQTAPGLRIWVWIGLSALTRLALEPFRANSPVIFGQLREIQVIAWLILALSLWQIGHRAWPAHLSAAPAVVDSTP